MKKSMTFNGFGDKRNRCPSKMRFGVTRIGTQRVPPARETCAISRRSEPQGLSLMGTRVVVCRKNDRRAQAHGSVVSRMGTF